MIYYIKSIFMESFSVSLSELFPQANHLSVSTHLLPWYTVMDGDEPNQVTALACILSEVQLLMALQACYT